MIVAVGEIDYDTTAIDYICSLLSTQISTIVDLVGQKGSREIDERHEKEEESPLIDADKR